MPTSWRGWGADAGAHQCGADRRADQSADQADCGRGQGTNVSAAREDELSEGEGRRIGNSNLPRSRNGSNAAISASKPTQTVVLWPDTWNNYYHPQTLAAAEAVLASAGFRVEVPKGHICCGRPLYDFGLLDGARSYLAKVLDRMAPQIDAGLPFIFLEPSCASVFKDEMLDSSRTTPAPRS